MRFSGDDGFAPVRFHHWHDVDLSGHSERAQVAPPVADGIGVLLAGTEPGGQLVFAALALAAPAAVSLQLLTQFCLVLRHGPVP